MELISTTKVRIGKTDIAAQDLYDKYSIQRSFKELPKPTIPEFYTRTSVYRLSDGIKIGEAKFLNGGLDWDVRCCHHPDYYFRDKSPTDCQKLSVFYFLCFSYGSVFEILYCSEDVNPEMHVLGGFGSLGYGRFKISC